MTAATIPIVVDLDGSLIQSDMLLENGLALVRSQPVALLAIPQHLLAGKAAVKHFVGGLASFDPQHLPYHQHLLAWLREQKKLGRSLILCTAATANVANRIAQHLGLFDEVLASSPTHNLSGVHKAQLLVERFGRQGFDYVGNSRADLPVWQQARQAIVVSGTPQLIGAAGRVCSQVQVFPAPATGLIAWSAALRLHQWLKNLLLWIPAAAAHQLGAPQTWVSLGTAFVAFGLLASALYLVNDLLDLPHDRQHPHKRLRPLASGRLPLHSALIAVPLLTALGLGLGWSVGGPFLSWLLVYGALSLVYSVYLKGLLLVDTLSLAGLYTLRVVAGAAAVGMGLSFWLLAFSVFLFLSLAFLKRYAELVLQIGRDKAVVEGRAYRTDDLPLVLSLGSGAGYAATIVLALYFNSTAVLLLYRTPEWLWATLPILIFWLSWMWMQAHRGQLHHDPLVFAVRSPTSLGAGALFFLVLWLGSVGWKW